MAKRGPRSKGLSARSGAKPVYLPPSMMGELNAAHKAESARIGYEIPNTTFTRKLLQLGMDALKGK